MEELTTSSFILDPDDYLDYESPLEAEYPFKVLEYDTRIIEHILNFLLDYVLVNVHIALCVSNLISSGLFFYVIYKFKRLQTRTNYILINFFICISCFSICMTVIMAWETFHFDSPWYTLHILYSLILEFVYGSVFFALLLAIDWLLSAYYGNIFEKYQRNYKWIIASVYFLEIVCFLFLLCTREHVQNITGLLYLLIYFVSSLVMAVFNIIKRLKTPSEVVLKTSYALSIPSIFFSMWLPSAVTFVICLTLIHVRERKWQTTSVFFSCILLLYLLEVVGFASPTVIVILLGRLDKNIKMAYDYVFKRSVRKYMQADSNIDHDNLDIDVP